MIQKFKNILGLALFIVAMSLQTGVSQKNEIKGLEEMFFDYEVKAIDSKDLFSKVRANGFVTIEIPKKDGGIWELDLHDSHIIGDSYLSQYADDSGVHEGLRTTARALTGNVKGNLYTSASITINNGFIYGFIKDKNGYSYVEPAYHFDKTAKGKDLYVVYNQSDLKPTAPKTCGVTDLHRNKEQVSKQVTETNNRSSVGECFEVEWAIANDFLMFQSYGSVSATENHAIGVANNVQTNYDDEFADEVQLIIVTQFTPTTSTADPWTSSTGAGTLLNDFTSWGPGGFGVTHDVGSLWTDRDFNGSTVGIAWLGVVCTNSRYNCLQDFTNFAASKRVMVAHELGHNFDSDHDNSGDPFIMAPSVTITSDWSSQSINSIESHISSRWCLDNCANGGNNPPGSDFTFNVIEDCTDGEVIFTSNSTGANLDYFWEFPGGQPNTSTQENPSVIYTEPGTFGATLTVTNGGGSDESTQNNIFTISSSPIVDYSFDVAETIVSFFNFTEFADGYFWDFGDGNSSNLSDPVHTYFDDGIYTVSLTAFSTTCDEVTTQMTVVIATPPTADFTSDVQEGCAPLTVQYTSQSSSNTDDHVWMFEGGTPETSTIANPVVVYQDGGTYDVILTVLNETGEDEVISADFIDVTGIPVADFEYVLTGNEITFTNNSSWGEDFIWVFGDGESSTEVNPAHTFTEDGDFLVTLTAENECGSNTVSTTITISLAPVPSFSIDGPSEGCAPMSVTFQSTSTNSPDSFVWNFEGGNPATSTAENPVITYANSGLYDVTLTVTNTNGSNTITLEEYIMINDEPLAGFSVSENGLTTTFIDASLDGDTYSWDFGDGNTSSDSNPIHTYDAEGNYTVILTVTNECGENTATQTINNYTAVSGAFGSNVSSGCADLTISFADQSSENVTSWEWTFEGGTPATSTSQNPTVSYNSAGQYDVILTVSHPESSETVMMTNFVSVSDVPTTSFEYFDDLFVVDFTNTTVEGETFAWDFGDGNSSAVESPNHVYNAEGNYTVTLTSTNACGSTTMSQNISINALPTAGFSATNETGCGPLTVMFSNGSSSNVTSWAWTFEGGTPSTSSDENPEVTFSSEGSYDVTLVVTSEAGSDMITQESFVVVLSEPTADIESSLAGNVISANNTGVGASSSTWLVNGETIVSPFLDYTFPSNGTYSITLTNENECGTASQTIEVEISAYPEINTSAIDRVICVGEETSFTENSTNVDTWMWTFTGSDQGTSSVSEPNITYSNVGIYDVSLTIINAFGENTMSFEGAITVIDIPTAEFVGMQTENTILFASDIQGATTFFWDFGDGNTSNEENPSYEYTSNGTYQVTLTASNQCGEIVVTESYTIISNAVTEADFAEMKVYPNPASDYLTIDVNNSLNDKIQLNVIDVRGRVISSEAFNGSSYRLNTGNLINGTYMLRLSSDNATFLRKVVILK